MNDRTPPGGSLTLPARVPKQLHVVRRPTPDVEAMIDDAKTGLAHQLAQYRMKMSMETLDPKEMTAFKACVDALEKLARLEGIGVSSYDVSGLRTEDLERLESQARAMVREGKG